MAEARRTRILIVDDSAVMRSLLRSVVSADPSLEVAGTAADGASALNSLPLNCPDLILLDVEMPVMDGLVTLRELRRRGNRMPVIMCSSLTQRGAKVTIEALAGGASDYVTKPAGQSDREAAMKTLAQELIPRIHALTASSPCKSLVPSRQQYPPPVIPGLARVLNIQIAPPVSPQIRPQTLTSTPSVVAIGVSTGGPAALDVLLPMLPADFQLPVLIVQHMPEVFTRLFAERLNSRCNLRVCEAAEGDAISAGTIYIARGNWHMETLPPPRQGMPSALHLSQGPLENHCRPAVDVLFRSAARVYNSGVLGVVLTGMGSDGLSGCRIIREQGGSVLAQDEPSSTVWGMPGAVSGAGLANKVLPLDAIAPEILRIARRPVSQAGPSVGEPYREVMS
ncbi:MAG TPA: chemotaxis response regulator protein-glutamate methylesterase [Terracidiphilus sp.]|nr:chemotaxis response regulator protein-glutamate methylesterase [Terracidiphilus sp.]